MTLRVSCPYCNSGFDLSGPPPGGRVPCPRCGESVAVQRPDEIGLPQTSLNGDGGHDVSAAEIDATPTPSGLKPLALIAGAMFVAVAVGIGFWLSDFLKDKPKPDGVKSPPTRATWPPQAVAGLRYLPGDSQLVFAVQPSPLLQYAERTNQDPNEVTADGGLPKPVVDWLSDAGIALDMIDHVAVGVKFDGIPPFAVLLALREPLADEGRFLQGMQARRDPDKNTYRVSGRQLLVPVDMVKVDDTKYLFASDVSLLAAAKKPAEGIGHFSKDLQDSIRKLSPASFVWLATDDADWTNSEGTRGKSLSLLATVGLREGDRWKRFDPKLRATAIGLSLETELTVRVSARYLDAATAAVHEKDWKGVVTANKGETTVTGTWATATVPLTPTEACGKVLKRIFTP